MSGSTTPPQDGERPVLYADRIGQWYATLRSDQQRKDHGLFLTPVPTADFMGRQSATRGRGGTVRILDPAAGAGILCCAAVEALMSRQPPPNSIDLVAYEVDTDLIAPLRAALDYLTAWCRDRYPVPVNYRLEATDFVMANAQALPPPDLFSSRPPENGFDLIIANPPCFKIGKGDPRANGAHTAPTGSAFPATMFSQANLRFDDPPSSKFRIRS